MLKILATEKSCLECKMSFFVNHVILIAKHYKKQKTKNKKNEPLVEVDASENTQNANDIEEGESGEDGPWRRAYSSTSGSEIRKGNSC